MENFSSELTDTLSKLYQQDPANKVDIEESKDLFEIAITFFSFQNRKILKLLQQRGQHIRNGDGEKIL